MKNLFYFISMILIITSCNDEVITPNSVQTIDDQLGVKCINGELYFDSSESFENTIDFIASKEDADLDRWEKKLGFTSYRKLKNDLLSELEKITVEEDYYKIIALNSDIVSLIDGELVFFVDDKIYASIVGKDRIYNTGAYMHKIQDDKVYSSSIIDLHHQNIVDGSINKDIHESKYIIKDNLKSTNCGTYQTASLTHDESGNANDRRVFIESSLIFYCKDPFNPYMGSHFLKLKVKVWGQKRNIFGTWISYNTALKFQSGNFNIFVHNSSLSGDVYWPIYNWTETSTSDCREFSCYKETNSSSPYPNVLPSNLNGFYFVNAAVEGSSRGFSFVEYAKINCGN
jgi:hypothetical protein